MKMFNRILSIGLIVIFISGCDDNKKKEEQSNLVQQVHDSMLLVKGGRYQMGDFGPLVGEQLPFSPDQDNKPLHWVELSDFKMIKNRITWGQFNKWLNIINREKNSYYIRTKNYKDKDFDSDKILLGDSYPASVNWNDARAFCQWIGKQTGQNIDLPTEAQWEYAARSRGQFRAFANSDNILDLSIPDDKLNFTYDITPVGSYPPNPLGLYDMMGNGNEWVIDWYAEDYYQHSPEKDPQGPDKGDKKVIRGYLGSMFGVYDITRGKSKPDYEGPGDGFRCVENSPLK